MQYRFCFLFTFLHNKYKKKLYEKDKATTETTLFRK